MKLIFLIFFGLIVYNVIMVGPPELKIGLFIGSLILAGAVASKGAKV